MGTGDESKLFVAGLPIAITEETLRNLFVETGASVEELSLPRDRMTGKPRGFAFVTLGSREQADAARSRLDGSMLEGRAIRVRPFSSEPPGKGEGRPEGEGRSGGQGDSDRTLYMGNLPYDITEQAVRDVFSNAGAEAPRQVHLPTDAQSGRPRGFGFVMFDTPEGASDALTKVREPVIGGRRCVVHLALPKGSRPAPREDRGFRPSRGGEGSFDGPRGGGGGGGGGGFRPSFGGPPPDGMGFGPRGFEPDAASGKEVGRRRKPKAEPKPDARRNAKKRGRSWDDDGWDGD